MNTQENQKKTDRRVLRTRRLLQNALTDLMLEKDINQISVKELSDYADVNRGTFYLHYKDVFDMVEKIEAELLQEFTDILDRDLYENGKVHHPSVILKDVFTFLKDHQNIVVALLGPHGDYSFISDLRVQIKKRVQTVWNMEGFNQEYLEYYNSFIISGCIGLLETWIKEGCKMSVDKISELSGQIVYNGIDAFSK